MDARDLLNNFSYQSMVVRQMADASAAVRTDSIRPSQSGWDNITGAAGAYLNRSDVSLGQAVGAAWSGGGRDLLSGVGHALGAFAAADLAGATSMTGIGTLAFGALAVQQSDALATDYIRFFGNGELRGEQTLLTQGLTPLIGANATNCLTTGIDIAGGAA